MVKLIHYKNSLIFSEIINCSAIELKFKGKFIGESKLGNDWYVGTGLKKIICISFNGNQDVSELFEFQGSFTIIGTRIVDKDLNEISCVVEKLDIDYFGRSKETFESGGSSFSDYDSTHEAIKTVDSMDIYKNDLFTKQNEFYYENGENYFGKYHQHSNGQAMSESSHTIDSVKIFRKDQKNTLYKPKPKSLRVIHGEDVLISRIDEEAKHKSRPSKSLRQTGEGTAGGAAGGGGVSAGIQLGPRITRQGMRDATGKLITRIPGVQKVPLGTGFAETPRIPGPGEVPISESRGNTAQSRGLPNQDPKDFQYKIIESDEVIQSTDPITFTPKENYPTELQARKREDIKLAQEEIKSGAKKLDIEEVTSDIGTIDRGIPIGGYTKIFEKLLDNIPIEFGVDFFSP